MKIALTIAGSDSGGGAGIQADLKTFHQFGVFGTSVIVALTAQNTLGVRAVEVVPEAMVRAQLIALAEDL
ncbi:MAG: hydroxymethylpyrimidine/phosphomethylpyrimidine kinase, partial [Gemmatimonadales bacterium]|nr:hydroxymethylpyrimidine/phosphomethylpyrimidine kinase [Gemmatimonadales bacterium]